ncbi:Uncharacterised protein [Mycobacteroides abscessus]|nr:Uncharacterised protein [Mycobacteroides abscessus]
MPIHTVASSIMPVTIHRVADASTAAVIQDGSGRPGRSASNRGFFHASATTAKVNVSAHAAPISA